LKRDKNKLLTILGPTASGKTKLAANVAYLIEGEIISADSRQVYRNMNIGTGKDYDDYIVKNKKIPYHLIDIVDVGYKYNVFEFQNVFLKVFNEISSRNKFPLLCGGTGLYVEAVTRGFKLINVPVNPELRNELEQMSMNDLTEMLKSYKKLHNSTEIINKKRLIRAIEIEKYYVDCKSDTFKYPEINNIYIGINLDIDRRREKISQRLNERLNKGLIKEVENLLNSGISKEDLIYYGLEYKFITQFLCDEFDYKSMFRQLETAIHQYAKRQMTWYRGMEKRGIKINWVEDSLPLLEKVDEVINILSQNQFI
jgi:tRNA dimethylallyltransferase